MYRELFGSFFYWLYILLHKLVLFNQPFVDEHLSCFWSLTLETVLK